MSSEKNPSTDKKVPKTETTPVNKEDIKNLIERFKKLKQAHDAVYNMVNSELIVLIYEVSRLLPEQDLKEQLKSEKV